MNYTDQQIAEAARAFRIDRGVPTDVLRVKRLTDTATIPTYGSNGAAGLDLYADLAGRETVLGIEPGERMLIKTGISIAIPRGHYARIAPRSGLAFKNGIDVLAGVVDEDYRGEVGVILYNTTQKDRSGAYQQPFAINHGDRIAQLIIEKYTPCLPVEVDSLDDTSRGVAGFGSTGK